MDFNDIIRDHLRQITDEFEQRKTLFLNIMHQNIDVLAQKAPEWFGDTVPDDFTEVLNSLMTLSISYVAQSRESEQLMTDQTYDVFSPVESVSALLQSIRGLFHFPVDCCEGQCDLLISTARKVFEDSVQNILLCMSQFADGSTSCNVKCTRNHANIQMVFSFHRFRQALPEVAKLMRPIFTVSGPAGYDFRIGLHIPFDGVKRIGGSFNVQVHNDGYDVDVIIGFPSAEFLRTVDDVRRQLVTPAVPVRQGLILLCMQDQIIEMVLQEQFTDSGYQTRLYSLDKIRFLPEPSSFKAVVLDSGKLNDSYRDATRFYIDFSRFKNVVVVQNKDDQKPRIKAPNIRYIRLPFEIENIVDLIEQRKEQ